MKQWFGCNPKQSPNVRTPRSCLSIFWIVSLKVKAFYESLRALPFFIDRDRLIFYLGWSLNITHPFLRLLWEQYTDDLQICLPYATKMNSLFVSWTQKVQIDYWVKQNHTELGSVSILSFSEITLFSMVCNYGFRETRQDCFTSMLLKCTNGENCGISNYHDDFSRFKGSRRLGTSVAMWQHDINAPVKS